MKALLFKRILSGKLLLVLDMVSGIGILKQHKYNTVHFPKPTTRRPIPRRNLSNILGSAITA